MPGIPMTLGDAADLTDVAIQRIWILVSDLERTTTYDKYFNIEAGVTDRLLRDSSLTGLTNAARVIENSIITGEAPLQGNDQTYTQVEYGKLMSFTKQMLIFGISWMATSLYKLRKLREHLYETIRSQATAIKKAVEGSTTIIEAPLVGDGIV